MSSRTNLICLALGAFAIGTESYVIAGLLPELAADLGVSVSLAGQLITVFALAYAIGSPLLAVATGNLERRRLRLGSLAVFALFNVMAATVHSYSLLMVARVGLAAAAATFMPAASAYAVEVTPVAHRGRALAIIYTGLTVATVIGVPTGVMIGEHFGWRYSFVIVGVLAVVAWVGLWLTLSPVRSPASASLAERIAIARRPDVLGALVVTVLTITGAFTVYSYLAPFLKTTAHISGTSLAIVLFVFGVGSAVGNWVSGSASDRVGPGKIVKLVLGVLVILFSTLSIAGSVLPPSVARWVIVPTLAIWGFVGWSFPAAQQARFVAMAPRLAPITLSLNASAIYLGVSLGAILGAWVVAHHHVTHLGWIGAACEVMALGLMFRWAPHTRRAGVLSEPRSVPVTSLVEDQPQNT
jgi:predicted MFS family arabinose efflux permease